MVPLAEETGPPVLEIGEQLVANAVRHERDWNNLEGVYFSRIAADMKGSAGGDGWTGLEISRFPPALWDLFALNAKGGYCRVTSRSGGGYLAPQNACLPGNRSHM